MLVTMLVIPLKAQIEDKLQLVVSFYHKATAKVTGMSGNSI